MSFAQSFRNLFPNFTLEKVSTVLVAVALPCMATGYLCRATEPDLGEDPALRPPSQTDADFERTLSLKECRELYAEAQTRYRLVEKERTALVEKIKTIHARSHPLAHTLPA